MADIFRCFDSELHKKKRRPRGGMQAEEELQRTREGKANLFLALHWMCTYIDALCVPTMNTWQLNRIQFLCRKASWYWYKYMPPSMHTLLTHAMMHLAEQAEYYGPQCLYWLFHKERSHSPHQLSLMSTPWPTHAIESPPR